MSEEDQVQPRHQLTLISFHFPHEKNTGLCSAVSNVSDCRSRAAGLILTWSHTFMEIDHEIISMAKLLPSTDSRRVVVNYKRNYVYEVPVNHLVKPAQDKSVVR